jgi:hypothetical protein
MEASPQVVAGQHVLAGINAIGRYEDRQLRKTLL